MQMLFQSRRLAVRASSLMVGALAWADAASAAVFGGPGVHEGIDQTAGVGGISSTNSVIDLVINVMTNAILPLVLIVAALCIVIAGIYLIVGNGDEGQKDKAKKIIIYCVVGILVILCARVIVIYVNATFG